ncbi:MAG: hypothetical protein LBC97_15365 [Bifidobacteriaceae bacterium]|jgi:hypothetical protein|nr:hypothetical protein [Bifidobacteriaceae bacterium]
MVAAAYASRPPGRQRSLAHDAVWGLGTQALLGVLLGWVWLVVSPRPAALWAGNFWYAQSDTDFGALQDLWFGALTLAPGLVAGALLVRWSDRPAPLGRAGLWMGGSVLGSLACWATGVGLSGGFGSPALAASAEEAPVVLTSYGLLALWPFAAAAVLAVSLLARASFGRTW